MLSEINPARFHPLIVHLPIGLLLFALIMEVLKRGAKQKKYDSAIQLCLLLGAVTAVFAAISGWGLAAEGGYEKVSLFRHRWLGITVAIGAVLTYWSYRFGGSSFRKIYPVLLLITNSALILAGHFGGVMTHGANYLFATSQEHKKVANIAEADVYEVIVAPILAQKCLSCHKATKSKGELRLDGPAYILAGGESGPVFDKMEAAKSRLLERIHLPMSADEHMPPEGKPQLSANELSLLRWWIENGYCFDCTVKDLPQSPAIDMALKAYEAPQDHWSNLDLPPLAIEDLTPLQREGIRAMPLAENSPFIVVDLARRSDINKQLLRKLRPVRKRLVALHAAFSNFSDADADFISKFPNLRKLELQGTDISDKALEAIQKLEHLESLNLYKTAVTDFGIQSLGKNTSLKRLYLWQSAVSMPQAIALGKQEPELEILMGPEDSIFGQSALNPPVLEAATTLFQDSIIVRLTSNLDDVQAYYTLDGTRPDTNAYLFKDSLVLRSSALLKVMQVKRGWLPSPVNEKHFVKVGMKIERAELLVPASGKYTANGGRSLIDLQKGSPTFTDGKWLGFEGKHMGVRLDLGKDTLVHAVVLSALSRPASWIFFPRGIKIYTSIDGKEFALAKEKQVPVRDKEIADEEMTYFKIEFPEQISARYLKIEVESPLLNPEWHPNPGGKSWIFMDEILVE